MILLKNSGPVRQSWISHVRGCDSGVGLASLSTICRIEVLVPWYTCPGITENLKTPVSSIGLPVTQYTGARLPNCHLMVTLPVTGFPDESWITPSTPRLLQPLMSSCLLPST
jgi:hypothetical protein